jgi:hypothetical protein
VNLLADGAGWISAVKSGDNLAPILKTTDNGATWQRVDFNELPAPLLLFIGIPLFALAVFVVFYQKLQIVEAIGVDPVGSSDKPIGWDDPDPLHFKPVAKGLSYFLRNQNTEPPLTIGINGPWGTGKSSLMNLVMEDLRQYGCSPVWFNAWHHQKEEHLLAALLENIRKQAVPKLWQRDGIKFRLRLLWLRTRGEVKLVASIALVILGLVLLDRLFSGGSLVRAISNIDPASLGLVPNLLRDNFTREIGVASSSFLFVGWLLFRLRVLPSDPAKLLAGLGDRVSVRGMRDQLGFRYKFGSEFKQVCTALRTANSPGLVILIDDLDRCQPPNVLEVLEAVNYLATVGDCFIILGMARRQVENCVAIGFKDFIVEGMEDDDSGLLQVDNLLEPNPADAKGENTSGDIPNNEAQDRTHATDNQRRFARRYLEKLINIEVAVPRGNPDQAAGLFDREKSESGRDSRLRQRQLMHKLSGLVQIVALVLLFGIIGAGVAPLLPQGDGEDPGIGADEVRSGRLQDAVEVLTPTDSHAIREPPVAQTETGETEPVIAAAPSITISSVSHASMTASRSPWTWWGPPALIFAMFMLFLLRRRLRPADTIIEDTEGFTGSLKRWYPLIYAVNPTPRAIKRFENRIRYIAMQARPPQQSPDFIDHIIDWTEKYWSYFRRRQATQGEQRVDGEGSKFNIDDEMLVALGAVEALDATTIQEKSADEISQLVSVSTADLLERTQATQAKGDDKFVEQLDSLNQFIAAGEDWPPDAQDLYDYRRLSGQIRG